MFGDVGQVVHAGRQEPGQTTIGQEEAVQIFAIEVLGDEENHFVREVEQLGAAGGGALGRERRTYSRHADF